MINYNYKKWFDKERKKNKIRYIREIESNIIKENLGLIRTFSDYCKEKYVEYLENKE